MVFASIKSIVSSALKLFPRRKSIKEPPPIVEIDAKVLSERMKSDSLISLPIGFLQWNFQLKDPSTYTFHTFTFTKPSLGITINVRKEYSVIVSAIRLAGKDSGLAVGDIIVAINDEPPRPWLDMVAGQLKDAQRPMQIKVMRVLGENEVITKALEEPQENTSPLISSKDYTPFGHFSPKTALAFAQYANRASSTPKPGETNDKPKKGKGKSKGKTPARKGKTPAKSTSKRAAKATRVADGTPSRKIKKAKTKSKKKK